MRVILSQDVKDLGKGGSLVEVSEGYARNFLFPRKLALEATDGAMKKLQEQKAAEAKREAKALAAAQALGKELEEVTVEIKARVGQESKLYGTVTSKEIAEAIEKQTKHKVDKRKIDLEEPIKTLGTFPFALKVHPQVVAKMKVHVSAAEA